MIWRRAGALLGLLALKLLLEGALLREGFVSVSGDDFQRALIAHEWARRPFFVSTEFDKASSLWLPLQFWINGAVLMAIPEPWLVPIAINLALSLGGLLYLYGIARRLFDHETGLLAVVLIGVLPWHAWLSISGLAEIPLLFFLSAGLYYLIRWEFDPAPHWALLAGVATLGATMVRPEGWLYGLLFSARFGAAALRGRRWWLLVGAGLPLLFIGYWLLFNYLAYGQVWHFVQLSRRNFQLEAQQFDSASIRLLQFPLLMAVISPTLSVLLVPSLLRAWRRGAPAVGRFVGVVGGGFGLLMGAGLFGLGTTSAPQRYVVVPLALFTPLIAGWCRQVLWGGLWKWLPALGVFVYIFVNVLFGFQFSREFQDEARVARLLASMRDLGLLDARALIASDWGVAARGPGDELTPERRIRLLVDRWALQILSGMPEAFVEPGHSVAARDVPSSPTFGKALVIAVKTPGLMPVAPPGFTPVGRVGTYRLYTAGILPAEIPPSSPLPPTTSVRAEFGAQFRFEGYVQDIWSVPRVVRLVFEWTDGGGGAEPLVVRVRLIGDGAPVAVRSYSLQDYLPVGPRPRSVEVPVHFEEEFKLPAGRYRLGVTVQNASGITLPIRGQGTTVGEVVLGPFYLIRSKREILKGILTARNLDPWLVARVLLTL